MMPPLRLTHQPSGHRATTVETVRQLGALLSKAPMEVLAPPVRFQLPDQLSLPCPGRWRPRAKWMDAPIAPAPRQRGTPAVVRTFHDEGIIGAF